MITYNCVCGKRYHVPDDKAGRRVRCPACGVAGRVAGAPDDREAIPVLQAVPDAREEAGERVSWVRENIYNLFGMGVVAATLIILGVFIALRESQPTPSDTAVESPQKAEGTSEAKAAPATRTGATTPAQSPMASEAKKPAAPKTDAPARTASAKGEPKRPKPKPDWVLAAEERTTPKAEPKASQAEIPFVAKTQPPGPKKEGTPSAQELSAAALFKAASPAVVRVDVSDGTGQVVSQGSGFLVSPDGYVVTNFHVIRNGRSATLLLTNEQKCVVDGVAALDRGADLALLKVAGTNLPSLEVAAQQLPDIGSKVYAIGSPKGLTNTLSEGLVSGHREMRPGLKVVQTTAAISPGSSGGPLLAADGRVVGVTSSQVVTGQNLNFAIPADRVAKLIAARGAVRPMDTLRPEFGPSPTEKDPLGFVGTWVEDWPGVRVHDISRVTYSQGMYKVQVLNPGSGPYDVENVRLEGNILKFTEYAGDTPIDYEVRRQDANTCSVIAHGGPANGPGIVWRRDTTGSAGQVGPRVVAGANGLLVANARWETPGVDIDLLILGPNNLTYRAANDALSGPAQEITVAPNPPPGDYRVVVIWQNDRPGIQVPVSGSVQQGGRPLADYQVVLTQASDRAIVAIVKIGPGSGPGPAGPGPVGPGERDPAGFAGTWVEYWPGVGVHDLSVVTYRNGRYAVEVTNPTTGPYRVANVRRLGGTLRFIEYPGNNVIDYEVTVLDATTLSVRARGGPGRGKGSSGAAKALRRSFWGALTPVGGWAEMAIERALVDTMKLNPAAALPYELRLQDFQMAMQDVYDFFYDVNSRLAEKGLRRLDDMLRPAIMSGVLSDMLTASLAKHSRVLTENLYFNGHPDLIVQGIYPGNAVKAGSEGIEVKTTRNTGGAVDTHGARDQWMCVFVYAVDTETEPARDRRPMAFTEVYLGNVTVEDFRKNPRGELGTRTATLHRDGIKKLRVNWIYRL